MALTQAHAKRLPLAGFVQTASERKCEIPANSARSGSWSFVQNVAWYWATGDSLSLVNLLRRNDSRRSARADSTVLKS